MNINEEREELRRRAEALDELGAILERVQTHAKYLSTIPILDKNDFQRLWMAAYEGVESMMSAGTNESLREAALNAASLDRLREMTNNDYVPMIEERPRLSFFRRRRN